MNSDELYDYALTIDSKEKFIIWLEAFIDEFKRCKGIDEEPENNKPDLFVEGIQRWLGDIRLTDKEGNLLKANQPSWPFFAEMFQAGLIYE